MKATMPHVMLEGDSDSRIMARSGTCLGMSDNRAVWRFGFGPESEAAQAYGVTLTDVFGKWQGFYWVLATRKTGTINQTFLGYAIELPDEFRKVIDWECPPKQI